MTFTCEEKPCRSLGVHGKMIVVGIHQQDNVSVIA